MSLTGMYRKKLRRLQPIWKFITTASLQVLYRIFEHRMHVTNTADLYKYCFELFRQYDYQQHLDEMRRLNDTLVDVSTLAQFLGRARMAAALPTSMKNELGLPEFILPEAQLNSMIRDYYTDENFGGFGREITAWQFYMLLTNYPAMPMSVLKVSPLLSVRMMRPGIGLSTNNRT